MLVSMVLIRTAALLVLMKVLAVLFGSDGFGQLSQVLAIGALFSVLSGGGLTNGIVRNVAAAGDQGERLAWIKAAVPIAAAAAGVLGAIACLLYFTAASALFPGQEIGFVLLVMAISQAVVGFGNIANAYLSGTHQVRTFATANTIGSMLAAVVVAALALAGGFRGAAAGCAAMALMPALVSLVAAGRRVDWWELRSAAFDRVRSLVLLRFGTSMYVAAAAVPLVWVYVRSDLALRTGWDAVGLWQSVSRISEAYMQVFGVIFMNYALPHLAAARGSDRMRRLRNLGLLVFALFVPGAAVLYLFGDIVIALGFSPAFTSATVYLAPQIIGDACKLVSLLFVYYLMSLNRAAILAAMELLQAGLIVLGYWRLLPVLGDRAPVVSYAAATAVVMVVTLALTASVRTKAPEGQVA